MFEVIGTTLTVAVMLSSVLLALMIWLFSDSSKLTTVEKNSWYYWNKDVLLKSIQSKQASLIWLLVRIQKFSLLGLSIYLLAALVVKYGNNT